MRSHFQVGIIVEDLEKAMAELSAGLGVEWLGPQVRHNGPWDLRIVFTRDAPYLELMEGIPGSPWDPKGGPHVDHLGFWSEDIAEDRRRLEAAGATYEEGGQSPLGGSWAYVRCPNAGFRVELCSTDGREAFFRRWNLVDPEAAAASAAAGEAGHDA